MKPPTYKQRQNPHHDNKIIVAKARRNKGAAPTFPNAGSRVELPAQLRNIEKYSVGDGSMGPPMLSDLGQVSNFPLQSSHNSSIHKSDAQKIGKKKKKGRKKKKKRAVTNNEEVDERVSEEDDDSFGDVNIQFPTGVNNNDIVSALEQLQKTSPDGSSDEPKINTEGKLVPVVPGLMQKNSSHTVPHSKGMSS